MAFEKLTTAESEKYFEIARSKMMAAASDRNDPVTTNFYTALHNYVNSILAAEVEIVKGINDLLDRVDRIETQLRTSAAGPLTTRLK